MLLPQPNFKTTRMKLDGIPNKLIGCVPISELAASHMDSYLIWARRQSDWYLRNFVTEYARLKLLGTKNTTNNAERKYRAACTELARRKLLG